MKLRFVYPSLDQLGIFLATKQYEDIWLHDEDKIVKAFHALTGLNFQQRQISVRVHNGQSMSGSRYWPMRLNVNKQTLDEKKAVLLHELGHRLLGGNGINSPIDDKDESTEDEERRLGLFIFDVYEAVYGMDFVKTYVAHAKAIVTTNGDNSPALREGIFASYRLSFTERQQKLRHLIATNELEK